MERQGNTGGTHSEATKLC